jgi:solute carrier family 29 (equilibrative nucleoside transporter), member 1/2/3
MESLRNLYRRLTTSDTHQRYEPISSQSPSETEPLRRLSDEDDRSTAYPSALHNQEDDAPFSWLDYAVFLALGVAMLWAWNMFLAAGPYFQKRFDGDDWILRNFQPAELSVSTVMNLCSVTLLANLQAKASYPGRITAALILNVVSFTLLAVSTTVATGVSPGVYFGFLIVNVLVAALATGLLQNGLFAYVSGFGREEYTQGIMTGQAVAGVAPCVVQIVSVLSAPAVNALGEKAAESTSSAFAYFLTASAISFATLLAFLHLARRRIHQHHYKRVLEDVASEEAEGFAEAERKTVPLFTLLKKTRWLASAVFLDFAVTMIFPVFTQKIPSIRDPTTAPRIFQPSTFIPLAFLFWNSGDLVGRLLTALPSLRITHRPRLVLMLAVSRIAFLPLYYLCNINGQGAAVSSDAFYLVVVQFFFGMSNGFVGSTCMMGAVEYVDPEEREATGGFMGLCLVAGLTVGSLLSFLAAQA